MKIKLLIVDDSAVMRMLIANMLEAQSDIEVVGIARNGQEAISKVLALHPDVITMDIEMPEMNGIKALQQIMQECPTPVIMLSSLTTEGADATIEALTSGAVDFLSKSVLDVKNASGFATELLTKIRLAAQTSIPRLKGGTKTISYAKDISKKSSTEEAFTRTPVSQIVAIGASTGGPRALETVLQGLPKDIPCALVIVQHMPPKFTASLAARLDMSCKIRVVEAHHNQSLCNGAAYIAPGGLHMKVVQRGGQMRIVLNDAPKRNEHRPSADVLFESLATCDGIPKHLVLMTGMGNDGAAGMALAKQSRATTIAQSADTCTVYGMPRAAVELGVVDYIVPIDGIAEKIMDLVQATQSRFRSGMGG